MVTLNHSQRKILLKLFLTKRTRSLMNMVGAVSPPDSQFWAPDKGALFAGSLCALPVSVNDLINNRK